jgi:hypothetical protein
MHVGAVQANTPLQPSLLLALRQMRSSTMAASTGRWTARRRLIQATNVKTTISLCPRAGRWQPTTLIQYTSSDRPAGEQQLWLLQMDMYTGLFQDQIVVMVPGLCSAPLACLRLGQRT